MDTMFTKGEIQAALECASGDGTRFHLCAVHVGDGYLCSTDGHRLLQIKHKAEAEGAALIGKGALKLISATRGAASVRVNGKLEAHDKNGALLASAAIDAVEARFPPVEQVIPKDQTIVTYMDPKLLGNTLLAMAKAGVECVTIHRSPAAKHAELDPMLITGQNPDGAAVVAVIMPRRK